MTKQLLDDLEAACAYVMFLADCCSETPEAAWVEDGIRRVRRDIAEVLGQDQVSEPTRWD